MLKEEGIESWKEAMIGGKLGKPKSSCRHCVLERDDERVCARVSEWIELMDLARVQEQGYYRIKHKHMALEVAPKG